MGLGPMVCIDCKLFAKSVRVNDGPRQHICPRCNRDSGNIDYMWMFTEDEQQAIIDNNKFYRFVAGEE